MASYSNTPGADATALLLDVTKPEAVRDAAARLGRVDILVNNAAIDAKVTAQPGVANGSRLEVFPLAKACERPATPRV